MPIGDFLQQGNFGSFSDTELEGLEVRDLSTDPPKGTLIGNKGALNKATELAQNLASSAPQAFQTPGAKINGTTPAGVPEAEEMKQQGKALGALGDFLTDPNSRRFMADLGLAFVGGRQDTAAGVLSQAASRSIDAQGFKDITAKLNKGESLEDIDTSAFSPEVVQAAIDASQANRRLDQGDRSLDVREREADQGDKRLEISDRLAGIQEAGLELRQNEFDFNSEMSETELALAERRVEIGERQTEINQFLADIRAFEAMNRDKGGNANSPDILKRREEAIQTLTGKLEEEQFILDDLKTEMETAESKASKKGFAGFGRATDADKKASLIARSNFEIQQNYVNNLQSQITGLSNLQSQATGGEAIGSPSFVAGSDVLTGIKSDGTNDFDVFRSAGNNALLTFNDPTTGEPGVYRKVIQNNPDGSQQAFLQKVR